MKVDTDHYILPAAWNRLLDVLRDKLAADGSVTLAEYRDLLHTSRKYSQMYLEAFDRRKYTKLENEVHYPVNGVPEPRT